MTVENIRIRMDGADAPVKCFSLLYASSPIHSLPADTKPYHATRYDYEKWFHNFDTQRPLFLTGVFDDYVGLSKGEGNIEQIQKTHRHFFNEIHRRIYKKSKRKLPRIVVIERGNGRLHSHIVIETPEHLSKAQFHQILTAAWKKTKHGVNLHTVVGYDKNGLDEYCSKELGNDKITYSQVDDKNCCITQTS